MAYLEDNPKTKKEAKQLAKDGKAFVFQPGVGSVPRNGTIALEGPHYPAPHTWYGTAHIKDGVVTRIT